MPRVSRAETEKNRLAIEEASSKLFRERGLSVSVADVMRAAGLTHGGFYGHFKSKDELAAIACAKAFEGSAAKWKERVAAMDDAVAARNALIKGYLHDKHRTEPSTGCPLASLVVDVSREDSSKPVRDAFHQGLEQLVDVLSTLQPEANTSEVARQQALEQLSTLVGAMLLARATEGTALSDELLLAARTQLLQSK